MSEVAQRQKESALGSAVNTGYNWATFLAYYLAAGPFDHATRGARGKLAETMEVVPKGAIGLGIKAIEATPKVMDALETGEQAVLDAGRQTVAEYAGAVVGVAKLPIDLKNMAGTITGREDNVLQRASQLEAEDRRRYAEMEPVSAGVIESQRSAAYRPAIFK